MRYPATRKAETHRQIVDMASRQFRSRGVQGIGIADLMAQVGLTQGGFYAHFKDRDALVAEATQCAAQQSLARLLDVAAAAPGHEIERMLELYLSPGHRDDPSQGCFLPTLAADIARQPAPVRAAFTDSLKRQLRRLARLMPGAGERTRGRQAMTMLAAMAGGVLIARAVDDPKLSDELLSALRSQLLATYGAPGH